jgi:hypothetical protein
VQAVHEIGKSGEGLTPAFLLRRLTYRTQHQHDEMSREFLDMLLINFAQNDTQGDQSVCDAGEELRSLFYIVRIYLFSSTFFFSLFASVQSYLQSTQLPDSLEEFYEKFNVGEIADVIVSLVCFLFFFFFVFFLFFFFC